MEEQKMKVIAVDDDDVILDIYEQGLPLKGYEVKTFADPKKAKEFLLSTDSLPDAILMDIMMPSIDGISLMNELHSSEKTAHIPIIAVSGLQDAATLNDALLFGAIDYVVKPFEIDFLDAKIKRAVEVAKKRAEKK
ncbi:MAG: response regulator [Elusimicrobia bacterium]|nr:response regulator [Elusimicrobiota bacterium]